jgi:hypothetical protein
MSLHADLLAKTLELYDIPALLGSESKTLSLARLLTSGWYKADKSGAWARGDTSIVKFRLTGSFNRNTGLRSEKVTVTIEGKYLATVEKKSGIRVNGSDKRDVDLSHFSFDVGAEDIPGNGCIEITIDNYKKKSPLEMMLGGDHRKLSFKISRLTVVWENKGKISHKKVLKFVKE